MAGKKVTKEQFEAALGGSCIDLASKALESKVVAFSDEFFAAADNLLTPGEPVREVGKFVETGAWYDGWETRRHNSEEADWVVIKFGASAGRVYGIEVDTAHFNGNHAPEISVEGALTYTTPSETAWVPLLNKQECGPSQKHFWLLRSPSKPITHVRLRMYPDGGIARFRVWGKVEAAVMPQGTTVDLASVLNGGVVVSASDAHFGRKENLICPGRGVNMGDGWETKRTRGKHVDWAVIKLAVPGTIESIVADTLHFRGNFPREIYFEGIAHKGSGIPKADSPHWKVLTQQNIKGAKDTEHEVKIGAGLRPEVQGKVFTHVKLVIVPDGGVKRVRVFGKPAPTRSRL